MTALPSGSEIPPMERADALEMPIKPEASKELVPVDLSVGRAATSFIKNPVSHIKESIRRITVEPMKEIKDTVQLIIAMGHLD